MTPEQFKQRREQLGLSQGQLAHIMDCEKRVIQRLEKGECKITRWHEYGMRFVKADQCHVRRICE